MTECHKEQRRRYRNLLTLLAAAATAVPLIGLSGVAAAHSATIASTTTGSLKPEVSGIFDRNGMPPASYQRVEGGYVVVANWANLQPTAGGPIAANNVIDQAIANVRQVNSANPKYNLRLKVRIFAGINAPTWAKQIDGGPFTVNDPQSGVTGSVGKFWTADFGNAYADFVNKLAAGYDSVPEIGEFTLSRATTIYAEPFQRQTDSAASVKSFLAAGFSPSADIAAMKADITTASVFTRTHVSMAFNPYQQINADGSTQINEAVTENVMDYGRQTLGSQFVLENNSIRTPMLAGGYPAMYKKMQALGAPIAFQTATTARVGDIRQTLQWAVNFGANVVEWPGGLTASQLAPYDTALKNNP